MLIRFAGAIRTVSAEIAEEGITDQQYKATVIVLMMAVVLILAVIALAVVPFAMAVVPLSLLGRGDKQ